MHARARRRLHADLGVARLDARGGDVGVGLRDLLGEDALVGHALGQLVRHEHLGQRLSRVDLELLLDGDERGVGGDQLELERQVDDLRLLVDGGAALGGVGERLDAAARPQGAEDGVARLRRERDRDGARYGFVPSLPVTSTDRRAVAAILSDDDERLAGEEIGQALRLHRRHVDAGEAQRHVGEHGAVEPLVQARHGLGGRLALAHDLGGAAAGARHAFDEVAIHRRADAEAEDARAAARGARCSR